jgi:hypothetical protein
VSAEAVAELVDTHVVSVDAHATMVSEFRDSMPEEEPEPARTAALEGLEGFLAAIIRARDAGAGARG